MRQPRGGHSSAASEPLTRAPDDVFLSLNAEISARPPLFWHFSFALHSTSSSCSIYSDLVPSESVVSFACFQNEFGVPLFQPCGLWQIPLSIALHTSAESCIIQPCISKFSPALTLGLEGSTPYHRIRYKDRDCSRPWNLLYWTSRLLPTACLIP